MYFVTDDNVSASSSVEQTLSPEKGIFNRLGGATTTTRRTLKRPATSTQPDEITVIDPDAAEYIGVLKDVGKPAIKRARIIRKGFKFKSP